MYLSTLKMSIGATIIPIKKSDGATTSKIQKGLTIFNKYANVSI